MAVVTWNPSDKSAGITLSNGNLTAVSTATPGGVRATQPYSGSGKYYWETTASGWSGNTATGIASASAVLTTVGATPTQAALVYVSGNIWVNNANSGSTLGARGTADTIGIALDVAAGRVWFRVAPSGNWNGSGTANPATNTGGISVSALSGAVYQLFCAGPVVNSCTLNAAGAFSGTVPSGFVPAGDATAARQFAVSVVT